MSAHPARRIYEANLDITGPAYVSGIVRTRALRLRRTDVAMLCSRAGIRYRMSGGRVPLVAFQRDGGHQRTLTNDGRTLYVVDVDGMPQRDPERALRILEVLAFGFNDYGARSHFAAAAFLSIRLVPNMAVRGFQRLAVAVASNAAIVNAPLLEKIFSHRNHRIVRNHAAEGFINRGMRRNFAVESHMKTR